jgi:hypothetical protein
MCFSQTLSVIAAHQRATRALLCVGVRAALIAGKRDTSRACFSVGTGGFITTPKAALKYFLTTTVRSGTFSSRRPLTFLYLRADFCRAVALSSLPRASALGV